MGMKITFDTNESFELSEGEYTNCHQFSREVFLKAAPHENPYKKELKRVTNDTLCNTCIYTKMIENRDAKEFGVEDIATIPGKSLIIFADRGYWEAKQKIFIQHSMISLGNNHWIGANNLYTLGLGNIDKQRKKMRCDTNKSYDGVYEFKMGDLESLETMLKKYKMYYYHFI